MLPAEAAKFEKSVIPSTHLETISGFSFATSSSLPLQQPWRDCRLDLVVVRVGGWPMMGLRIHRAGQA